MRLFFHCVGEEKEESLIEKEGSFPHPLCVTLLLLLYFFFTSSFSLFPLCVCYIRANVHVHTHTHISPRRRLPRHHHHRCHHPPTPHQKSTLFPATSSLIEFPPFSSSSSSLFTIIKRMLSCVCVCVYSSLLFSTWLDSRLDCVLYPPSNDEERKREAARKETNKNTIRFASVLVSPLFVFVFLVVVVVLWLLQDIYSIRFFLSR